MLSAFSSDFRTVFGAHDAVPASCTSSAQERAEGHIDLERSGCRRAETDDRHPFEREERSHKNCSGGTRHSKSIGVMPRQGGTSDARSANGRGERSERVRRSALAMPRNSGEQSKYVCVFTSGTDLRNPYPSRRGCHCGVTKHRSKRLALKTRSPPSAPTLQLKSTRLTA